MEIFQEDSGHSNIHLMYVIKQIKMLLKKGFILTITINY